MGVRGEGVVVEEKDCVCVPNSTCVSDATEEYLRGFLRVHVAPLLSLLHGGGCCCAVLVDADGKDVGDEVPVVALTGHVGCPLTPPTAVGQQTPLRLRTTLRA